MSHRLTIYSENPYTLDEMKEIESKYINLNPESLPTLANFENSKLEKEYEKVWNMRSVPDSMFAELRKKTDEQLNKIINTYGSNLEEETTSISGTPRTHRQFNIDCCHVVDYYPVPPKLIKFLVESGTITGYHGYRNIVCQSFSNYQETISFSSFYGLDNPCCTFRNNQTYTIKMPRAFHRKFIENPRFMLNPSNQICLVGFTVEYWDEQ